MASWRSKYVRRPTSKLSRPAVAGDELAGDSVLEKPMNLS